MLDTDVAYVELLGLTLSGVGSPDRGLYWTDLEGWWGLPDSRSPGDPIPGGHGWYRRAQVLRNARVITLTGHILAKDPREFMEVRDRLEAALATVSGDMTVFTNTYGAWSRYVEIDTLTVEPDHGRRYTKFIVDMVAPDPRRYGPTQRVGPVGLPAASGGVRLPQAMPWNFGEVSAASRLVIPNPGLIDLQPTLIVSGGFSTATVVDIDSAKRLKFNASVFAGSELRIDCATRRAYVDGQDMTQWMTHKEWPAIPSGSAHTFRFEVDSASGDPQLWGEYREGAW